MLRLDDSPDRQIDKLQRINAVLLDRIERAEGLRGSSYSMFQAAMALEKEVRVRTRDLERALADLSQKNHELAAARASAEEANRSKTRFLRAASHDLLQPLGAAKLLLALLGDTRLDDSQGDLVKRLATAFESVEELMHAVLDIARLDSQRIEFNRRVVPLEKLFVQLGDEFQHQAAARGLRLRFMPTSLAVDSDPTFLRRIVQNLVSNSIKYTEAGRVLVGARRRGEMAWIEVHDTGIGIREEDQARIFEEFNRNGQEGRAPGMGLGLSIVQRACAKLGHPVELDSEPGCGSVFRVGLPMVGAVCPLRAPMVREQREDDALRGRAALIIENDPGVRDAYDRILRDTWGMRTHLAEGTEQACEVMRGRTEPVDVIVADYHLAAGDTGLAAIRAVRREFGAKVPAVIVTANRDAKTARAAARIGVKVKEKPLSRSELKRVLLRLTEAQP